MPPSPPLRTGRASFPASGSSLCYRTVRDGATLRVVVGMEKDVLLGTLATRERCRCRSW